MSYEDWKRAYEHSIRVLCAIPEHLDAYEELNEIAILLTSRLRTEHQEYYEKFLKEAE